MRVDGQSGDLFAQMHELLAEHSTAPEDVVMPKKISETTTDESSSIMRHVVTALQSGVDQTVDLRAAIANSIIAARLSEMGAAKDSPTAELTHTLLKNDPVFSRLVDQTILATTRELLGIECTKT
jgi:hypothetical protein